MTLLVAIALFVRFPMPRPVELPRFVPVLLSDPDSVRRNRQVPKRMTSAQVERELRRLRRNR